jgi:hypothetical protein
MTPKNFKPGVIMVFLDLSSKAEDVEQFLDSLGLKLDRCISKRTKGYVINVPKGKEEELLIKLGERKDLFNIVELSHGKYL